MIEFRRLVESLARNEAVFVIVGGIAATLHGSARLTFRKAAGRPKDFEAIAELEAIREERGRSS